jgi:hypothetical protein
LAWLLWLLWWMRQRERDRQKAQPQPQPEPTPPLADTDAAAAAAAPAQALADDGAKQLLDRAIMELIFAGARLPAEAVDPPAATPAPLAGP